MVLKEIKLNATKRLQEPINGEDESHFFYRKSNSWQHNCHGNQTSRRNPGRSNGCSGCGQTMKYKKIVSNIYFLIFSTNFPPKNLTQFIF